KSGLCLRDRDVMDRPFVTSSGSTQTPNLGEFDARLKEWRRGLSRFHFLSVERFCSQHRGTVDMQAIAPADAVARRRGYQTRHAVVARLDFAAEPLLDCCGGGRIVWRRRRSLV